MPGISGIARRLSAIYGQMASEWGEGDALLPCSPGFSDGTVRQPPVCHASAARIRARDAAVSYHQYLMGQDVAYMKNLTYPAAKRVHNLKYYTWVEHDGDSGAAV